MGTNDIIYTAEHFKWNKKFFIILFYDMKQKGDEYKLTAVAFFNFVWYGLDSVGITHNHGRRCQRGNVEYPCLSVPDSGR